MSKNYYEELIEKIEQLISKKENQEALKLIKDELSLPYIPKIYEDKIYYYYNLLNDDDDEKQTKKNNYFSRDEILLILNNYKNYDLDFLISIASLFDQYNWKGFEKQIEMILNFNDLDNKIKSLIYNCLVTHEINYDFQINNLKINPFKNKTIFETEYSLKNIYKIKKTKVDNPSIIEISQKIFFLYLMNLFPQSLFFAYEDVSFIFIKIANIMIGNLDQNSLNKEEEKIFKTINGK